MSDDDEFTPKLGRTKGKDGRRVLRYGGRILAAARLAGTVVGVRNRRFDGSRIGRGASMGRLLSSRDRFAGLRARRAIVKTRLVRLGGKAQAGARAHLRYIQRDGVTREGAPGELYGPETDTADGKAFLVRSAGDRHQFRFIVSAEDGSEYPDLKPYVRRLMAQAEQDLGTKLDWVAVDHFNTDQPHTHIMLRGIDETGQNLVIAREYIAHGFRERAAELATLDLGPRTDQEIEARLRHDVDQERLTAIDRRLLRRMDDERVVTAASNDPFQQSVATGRLHKLGEMGLAENQGGGRWQLADGMEDTLRRLGERGDIIRTMQRELTVRKLERAGVDRVIVTDLPKPIVGRVIHRGFSDEHRDRHYIMLDGVDGRVHYLDIGRSDATEAMPEGTIVRASARSSGVRPADQTIDTVARANDGRYSVEAHLRHDPTATEAFAQTHVRRLEAMRKAGAGLERRPDGSWTIGDDHVGRAAAYEARLQRDRPVAIERLSRAPLVKIATMEASTWLDREAIQGDLPIRDTGFGREVRTAVIQRQRWLVGQELADADETGRVRIRAGALQLLARRELGAMGEALGREIGKSFVPVKEDDRIQGTIARRVDLESGSFAVVEKSREFSLVPWRPVLDRQIGKVGTGIMRGDGISWQFGRGRSGPEVA